MRVSKITTGGDWMFGKGRAQYVANADAVRQNVVTRIRSFTNDWFADIGHGIDWVNLLGQRGNDRKILAAIEKAVLDTPGVSTITRLRLTNTGRDRKASIELQFTTLFDKAFNESVEIEL